LDQEKEELAKKLDETKKTIQQLRDSLNLIDSQKEEAFRKKSECGKQIRSLISKARQDKEQRNSYTTNVRKSKEERQRAVSLLREKSALLRQLNQEKVELMGKLSITRDPSFLKTEIERLEYKLETTVMSFEKEQKLMKNIKELQKQYNEMQSVSKVWEKIRETTKEIRDLKRTAEETHRMVQEGAKHSQGFHEQIIESGKVIDELKASEEEENRKFLDFKQQFNDVNSKLKEHLVLLNELNQKLNLAKEEKKKIRMESIKTALKSKEESVNEKIRKGEKLTTEDLLILQRTQEDI
jgi:uncharacterized coiled-coil DUF342 family protein